MTEKLNNTRRRGFIFVTYTTEDAVDNCTKEQFHVVDEARVRREGGTEGGKDGGRNVGVSR